MSKKSRGKMKLINDIKRIIKIIRKTETSVEKLTKVLLPFLISGLVVFGMWLSGTGIHISFMTVASVYLFAPLGMLAGIPVAAKIGVSMWQAIVFMIFADLMAALWIVWNLDILKDAPGIGRIFRKTQKWGEEHVRKNPKIRNFAFMGLMIFVLVPMYGSGSILGAIIGKIIAMKEERILLAILLGVTIRLTLMSLAVYGILSL